MRLEQTVGRPKAMFCRVSYGSHAIRRTVKNAAPTAKLVTMASETDEMSRRDALCPRTRAVADDARRDRGVVAEARLEDPEDDLGEDEADDEADGARVGPGVW